MKKFKEFRCVIEMSVLVGILVLISFYLGVKGSYSQMTMGFIIGALGMFGIFMSYNVELREDEISYYKWFGIAMWTKTISYNNIAKFRAVDKHKVEIVLRDKTQNNGKNIYTYVMNSEDFMRAAKDMRDKYRTDKKKNKKHR